MYLDLKCFEEMEEEAEPFSTAGEYSHFIYRSRQTKHMFSIGWRAKINTE
jgi:hypothetical protein